MMTYPVGQKDYFVCANMKKLWQNYVYVQTDGSTSIHFTVQASKLDKQTAVYICRMTLNNIHCPMHKSLVLFTPEIS